MNESQSAQLAAIRERKYAAADIGTAREDIAALLNLLADAERERDEIARDSEVLLGSEWRRSVQAVNGDPEAAREHRIAALVADLAVANERAEQAADARQAEIVGWLKQRANAIAVTNRECGGDYRLAAQANELDDAADAIERGEFRGKGGGDAN